MRRYLSPILLVALVATYALSPLWSATITLREDDGTVRTFTETPATQPTPETPPATGPVVVEPPAPHPPLPEEVPAPPVNVLALPAPTYQGTMAPLAIHWRVPDPEETTVYRWDFGDGSTMEGMNVAHVFAEQGTYTVTLTAHSPDGGKKVYEGKIVVPANTRRTVTTLADAARFGDTQIDLQGQTVVLGKTLTLSGNNVLIKNGEIRYIGPAMGDSLLSITGRNVVLQDVKITSALTNLWSKNNPTFVGGNAKNLALLDCTLLGGGYGLKSNGTASSHRMSGVLVGNCVFDGFSEYPIWFEGAGLVVSGGTLANSNMQHLARSSDATDVNFHGVRFAGKHAGSALTIQVVDRVSLTNLSVESVNFRGVGGTVSLGPLHSAGDAITTRPSWQTDQAKTIAVRGGTYAGIVHVCAAVDGVLIEGIKAPQVQITTPGDSRLAFRTWKNITLNNVDAPLTGAVGKVQGLVIDGKAQ